MFETCFVACAPAVGSPEVLKRINTELKSQESVQLLSHAQNLSLDEEKAGTLRGVFDEPLDESISDCTVFIIQGFKAGSIIQNLVGEKPSKGKGKKASGSGWRTDEQLSKWQWFVASNCGESEQMIRTLFAATLPTERSILLINSPDQMSHEDYTHICDTLKNMKFVSIMEKSCCLPPTTLQQFYDHAETEPSDRHDDCYFRVWIVERIGAVRCLRTVVDSGLLLKSIQSDSSSTTNTAATDSDSKQQNDEASPKSNRIFTSVICAKNSMAYERHISFWFPELAGSLTCIRTVKTAEFLNQTLDNGETLRSLIARGLTKVARERPSSVPDEVSAWFAEWLIENNPKRTIVQEP